MSDHMTPPPMPVSPPTPPPAPKKPPTNLVIMGSAAAVVMAVIATGAVVVQSDGDDGKRTTAARSSTPSADISATTPEAAEPTYGTVNTASFAIDLKTTSRQCFGSAGCNVTVEPELTYLGDSDGIDPDAVFDITYEIHGDESGSVIETAELSDRTSLKYSESMISTASASTEVSVEITDVTQQGL
ncbi:hypothetical protein ACWC6I_29875 [Streptomyces sp. NPDC001414]